MSEDVLKKYYEIFLEEVQTTASPEVPAAYKRYLGTLNDYVSAIQEDLFYQAFRYGYEQGLKANSKTEVA